MEINMRTAYAVAFTAFLAAGPALGQVVIQTPNSASTYHQQQANQDRADAHYEHQQAHRHAAVGDYRGAAEAQAQAHEDWRAAHRQEHRAQDESGAVVIGR
jgi:hypothetical protein